MCFTAHLPHIFLHADNGSKEMRVHAVQKNYVRCGMRKNVRRNRNRQRQRQVRSALEVKIKVCAAIVILIVLINAVNPSFLEKIRVKTGADRDHEVDQVVSMAVSAFYDAKAAVSEAVEAMSRTEVSPDKGTVEDQLDLENEG